MINAALEKIKKEITKGLTKHIPRALSKIKKEEKIRVVVKKEPKSVRKLIPGKMYKIHHDNEPHIGGTRLPLCRSINLKDSLYGGDVVMCIISDDTMVQLLRVDRLIACHEEVLRRHDVKFLAIDEMESEDSDHGNS